MNADNVSTVGGLFMVWSVYNEINQKYQKEVSRLKYEDQLIYNFFQILSNFIKACCYCCVITFKNPCIQLSYFHRKVSV